MERIVKGIWIPIEIWEAQDLSWNEKILLMEIDSFTAEGKDCFISDEYVSTLLGVNMRNANKCMANLIHKGYVEKTRFDGRRRFVQSKICRADLSLKTEQTCLQRQHTYIESTYISPTEIINNKGNRFDFKKALMEIGVTEQVAEDWLKVRKEAKASNTETAFKGILREIEKTGLSADECIRIAAENSWRGFKAEWIANQRKSTGKQSVLENNIAVAEELARLTKMI
jgi:hypothetical protein